MVRLVLEQTNGKWLWGPQRNFTLLGLGGAVGVGWEAELFHDYSISRAQFISHSFFFLKKGANICLALIRGQVGIPGGSDGKESSCNAGDLGSIPGSGRSPGEGNGYPLQYSCLENSMDRGAWRATVNGVAKRWT